MGVEFDWTNFAGCEPVKKGGSGRRFFRVGLPDGRRAVWCCYDASREENALYAPLARFLRELDFPVPEIWDERETGAGAGELLLEDAGEIDLWALREASWSERSAAYRAALRALHRLHHAGWARWRKSDTRLMPEFDAALYRWEREYFLENCLERQIALRLPVAKENLAKELGALAERLCSLPSQLVHRDCQSQNILWRDGRVVFIDFQGMRVGTGLYDVGSLLWDPYVKFSFEEREEMVDFYWSLGGWEMSREEFLSALADAAAQRLMQALGAYGFLGLAKKKTTFLAHTRPALENLVAVTDERGALANLHVVAQAALRAL